MRTKLDLEFATIDDIVNELANRGIQFIIAMEIRNNKEPFKIHLCVDGKKNKMEVAHAVAPLFDMGQTGV